LTIAEAIRRAAEKLTVAGIESSRLDAEVLLAHVIRKDRVWLFAHNTDTLNNDSASNYEHAVERRAKREPIQHIVGHQEFWGLDFTVSPDVLIPRPETELVVESAIRAAGKMSGPLILDLCTGSGCIAISIAKHLVTSRIMATDRSGHALVVARENARNHGVADRIRFLEGDLFGPLEELDIQGKVDIIVANPPYVPARDLAALQSEVRDFEPETALIAGPQGTEIHQRIISTAPRYLKQHGLLIMEMGIGQTETLIQMVKASDAYDMPEVLKDLAGIERVIVAKTK
jgi:release factor glutamine methyltransferase